MLTNWRRSSTSHRAARTSGPSRAGRKHSCTRTGSRLAGSPQAEVMTERHTEPNRCSSASTQQRHQPARITITQTNFRPSDPGSGSGLHCTEHMVEPEVPQSKAQIPLSKRNLSKERQTADRKRNRKG